MTSDCRPQLCSVHTHYTVLCPRGLGFWGLQSLWAFSQLRVNVRSRRVQRKLHERCKGSGSPDPHWARKVSSILLGMGTSLLLASLDLGEFYWLGTKTEKCYDGKCG